MDLIRGADTGVTAVSWMITGTDTLLRDRLEVADDGLRPETRSRRRTHHPGRPQFLSALTVVDREISCGGAGIHHDRHPVTGLVDHDRQDLVTFGLRQLEDLAAEGDPEAVDARLDGEVDFVAQARLVDCPSLVERRDEDRDDAP